MSHLDSSAFPFPIKYTNNSMEFFFPKIFFKYEFKIAEKKLEKKF